MSGPLGKKQEEVADELVTGVLVGGRAATEGGRSRRSGEGESEAVQGSGDVAHGRDRSFVENKEQSPDESMVTLATDAPFDRSFHCEVTTSLFSRMSIVCTCVSTQVGVCQPPSNSQSHVSLQSVVTPTRPLDL